VSTHGALHQLRNANRRHVIETLRANGSMTRSALAHATGLSRTTISTLLGELIGQGLVTGEADGEAPERRGAGRPAARVRLDHSAGAAVSIDVGARHVAVAVGDLAHRVMAERWTPLPLGHGAADGMERAATLAREMLAKAGVEERAVIGVAMGLPAPITQPGGVVASSNILPGWAGVQIAEEMADRLGMPVLTENDANLGALAESAWGAGSGFDHLAYIKAATGIGAGLITNGRPFGGYGGTAGEIGHTIIDPSGPICRCGNRGCLEMLAGTPALLAALKPTHPDIATAADVIARARDGDSGCARALTDSGRAIGTALATLCNITNPERIIVGGELGAAGDLVLDPMRDALHRGAIRSAGQDVTLSQSTLGERAEVLGAVALALTRLGHALER
jgi:predicted NBD/HSP70 family sugar kinase